ncbi:MAG: glycosyltransferase family 2 protein [Candidatus Pacearchaeota archaeon]
MKNLNKKKLISIVTPTFNEEENVELLYNKIKEIMEGYKNKYDYEHIFIDNCSTDRTVEILKEIAKKDKNVKIIVNSRNFGIVRSPYYGLLQTKGDCSILISADFQEPPELINHFIKKWEEGYKIVVAVKKSSKENIIFFLIRKLYYNILKKLSEVDLIKNYMGFGLYDKEIIEILKKLDDPYPYLRGIICDIGFEKAKIPYIQPKRKRGITKNNFYSLYDMAMLGITSHSKIPLRIATFSGFILSILSLIIALIYFIYKIIFWKSFSLGTAPLIIGLFFFSSINLFFLGILGEYIASIHTQVLKRPLVIEKERINF